jgi:D-glycero-D-manno-heptose 1,7-bisphosphate phosphatase
MARALFLDRDGVVNEEVGYLHRACEVRFVMGYFLSAGQRPGWATA